MILSWLGVLSSYLFCLAPQKYEKEKTPTKIVGASEHFSELSESFSEQRQCFHQCFAQNDKL